MSTKTELSSVVGPDNVSDDPELLGKYSSDYSLCTPRSPRYVVFATDTSQVQAVVRIAGQHSLPVTPRSSRVGFYGAGIPSQGGIVLDLTRMNKVLEVDTAAKKVKVQPGVTWRQLQEELRPQGVMVCLPLAPHPLKSVLTSSMEREPILIPKAEYADTMLTAELVLANGDLFWTGTALGTGMRGRAFPEGPIPASTRLYQGAQGTFGIMTWANIKLEWLPARDKLFFIPLEGAEDMAEPVHRIQRRMLGSECLVVDRLNMALLLAGGLPAGLEELRKGLPPWMLVVVLSGFHLYPEGRIEYEEDALAEIARSLRLPLSTAMLGCPGGETKLLGLLRSAWPDDSAYWKHRFKGSCQEVFFHTMLDRSAGFISLAAETASRYDYPAADISCYVQPLERGRACFCQFGFHGDPRNSRDVSRVRSLHLEFSEKAMDRGAFFTTPYGPWAEMVFSRAATYTATMKAVKHALDPHNIMNPGKLCF